MNKVAIKKIERLNRFGSFTDFTGNLLEDFKKYNLIWGWNGTGKTTLARFFYCLNAGLVPDDYDKDDYREDFSIEVTIDQVSSKISKFLANPLVNKIRVFNTDFVDSNLRLTQSNAKTDAITCNIGQERIEIETEIQKLKEENDDYYIDKGNKFKATKIREEKVKELENKCTTIATSIRSDLNIAQTQSFTRTQFTNALGKCTKASELGEITLEQKEEAAKVYRTPEKEKISFVKFETIPESSFDEIQQLLFEVPRRKEKISEELAKWLEQGLKFKKSDHCPFCEHNIATDWDERKKQILKLLEKDSRYEEHEKELLEQISILERMLGTLRKSAIHNLRVNDFVISVDEKELDLFKSKYREHENVFCDIIRYLKEKLNNKDLKPNIQSYRPQTNGFKEYQEKFCNKLLENNNYVSNSNQRKEVAKETVIKFYIAENFEKIAEDQKEIKGLADEERKIKETVEKNKKRINQLELMLSNQNIAIEEIETLSNAVFGQERFHFKTDMNAGVYTIVRTNGKEAKNLSEGEKTVIAFSYFLASLKAKDFDLESSIVVIDDPVSSLDQQYLFNMMNHMTNKFSRKKDFSQLFVLTHNFYFFKKVRAIFENINKSVSNNTKGSHTSKNDSIFEIFQMEKTDSSRISNANEYLRNFDSEYLHLINHLKSFISSGDREIFDPSVGNSIRKVLEIFLAFRCPSNKTLYTRFQHIMASEKLQKDKYKFQYLYDIANASSHTESCGDIEAQEEMKFVVSSQHIKQLFEFMRQVDKEHASQLSLP